MTAIEWTDATWNPVVGCSPVHTGCAHCYAVEQTARNERIARAAGSSAGRTANYIGLTVMQPNGRRGFTGEVRCIEEALEIPLRWRRPRRVFVNSMSDLFHERVPFDFIESVFAVMELCPRHTFQVLTKRPQRMAEYLANDPRRDVAIRWPLPNVWLGTSVSDQKTADAFVPHLLRCPAAVRFLSVEPLLGPVNLNIVGDGLDDSAGTGQTWHTGIHWVIVGGESGPDARPCVIGHVREIVRQCRAAGVPVFVKQLGSRPVNREGDRHQLRDRKGGDMSEWPEDLRVREWPEHAAASAFSYSARATNSESTS